MSTSMGRSMKHCVSSINEVLEHLNEAIKDDLADGDNVSLNEDQLLYGELLRARNSLMQDEVYLMEEKESQML